MLLNNDTIVAPGWLERLAAHAADPRSGSSAPSRTASATRPRCRSSYETYGGFLAEAAARARTHAGRRFELPMPAMFCLALRRDVHERVGPLDEGFGLGTLEDDDYAERARRAGYRLVCAEDVLVHHFGEGSLGRLFADGSHGALLCANRARFERKWGIPWRPYARRQGSEYERVRERVRELVAGLPAGGPVIVASRGDDEILRFPDRPGWHFPQDPDGVYAGYYPADGVEAVAELERLRARGGRWFLLPKTSLWWLEHYRELERASARALPRGRPRGGVRHVLAGGGAMSAATLERVRERIATTAPEDARLRTLLVLAHELLRQRALLDEARAATPRREPASAADGGEPVADYDELVRHVHATALATLPAGARVLVVSRGDEALLPPGLAGRVTSRKRPAAATPATTRPTAAPRSRTSSSCARRAPSSCCCRPPASGGSTTTADCCNT